MELIKARVSIITPCYNAENFIESYLHSIVGQSYKNIELILINDGSTDLTETKILEHKKYLEDNNILFKYISYSKNQGQAYALNKGLKELTGEYLCWFDCDDFMYPDFIKKKIAFLEQNPNYGFCSSYVNILNENGSINNKFSNEEKWLKREYIFWDILMMNCQPFHCLARTGAFLSAIKSINISTKRAGQNLQILLPLAYNSKFGYIEEALSDYIQHSNSHSNKIKNKFRHKLELYNIASDTLNNIKMEFADRKWASAIIFILKFRLFYSFLVSIKRKIIPFNIKESIANKRKENNCSEQTN